MKRIVAIIAAAALVAGLCYYEFAPSQIYKRKCQALLDGISATIQHQDRAQINQLLNTSLTDSAPITLQVDFPSALGGAAKDASPEKFSKAEFLSFIDNTLYTLSDYRFAASAAGLSLSSDRKTGTLVISGKAEANGSEMDGNVRFIGDTNCIADMQFNDGATPQFTKLTCDVQMQYGMKKAPASH